MGKQVVFYANKPILTEVASIASVHQMIFVQRVWNEGSAAYLAVYPTLDIEDILEKKVFRPLLIVPQSQVLPSCHEQVLDFTRDTSKHIELTLFFGKSVGYDSRIWLQTEGNPLVNQGNQLLWSVRSVLKKQKQQEVLELMSTTAGASSE